MEFIVAGMCFVFATVAMVFVCKLATIENEKKISKEENRKFRIRYGYLYTRISSCCAT